MSILLSKKDLKNRKALEERKQYLKKLLNEPRSNDGPSSQEWVSDEYYSGHRQLLIDEIMEIDKALRLMA